MEHIATMYPGWMEESLDALGRFETTWSDVHEKRYDANRP